MHPNRRFHWDDRDAMRTLVRDVAFGQLFATTPAGPRVAHLPAVWLDDETLGVHIARANAVATDLNCSTCLFVVTGADGYVSPDWYDLGPQGVPTWNYVAVELEGRLHRMNESELLAQLDQLAAEQEARLAPKRPWTRDKVDPAHIDRLLRAIIGFRLEVTEWRGTLKLGQNKPDAVRLAAADALADTGGAKMARWMRTPA